ncbi:MAG: 4-hydroxybenzoate octaprenyltransferase [Venatoribacter sp.]
MTQVTEFLNKRWPKWYDWVQLTRFNRPIGSYLLIGPTLWALWIAAQGWPDWHLLFIFVVGVFVMRSAGCVINDFADRKWDGEVKRTLDRPLVTGRLSAKEALQGFAVLVLVAFGLVLFTNALTIKLSFLALFFAALYPFTKRFTHLPQLFLGAAYSMSIPMAFAAQAGEVPVVAWLLFIANLLWTVAYDTLYAMVDRDDDLKVGIKSTAILFADNDLKIISLLYVAVGLVLAGVFTALGLGGWAYLGLVAGLGYIGYLVWSARSRSRESCFHAFLQNYWFGILVWAGLALNYASF